MKRFPRKVRKTDVLTTETDELLPLGMDGLRGCAAEEEQA